MLTQRQQRLLVLLLSDGGWLTSAQLADRLAVSGRLIKQEVSAIRQQLGQACVIQSSTHAGYRLMHLDESIRIQLPRQLDAFAGHHSIRHRYELMFLYLVTQDDPVSTGRLAERLYCSRSAVGDQIARLRYRVERIRDLTLVVSRQRGVSIEGPEWARRYEASKWMRSDCAEALLQDAADRSAFEASMRDVEAAAREVMAPLVRAGRTSGGDVTRIARYTAFSALRGAQGYAVEMPANTPDEAPFAQEVAAGLATATEKAFGYRFSDSERVALAQLVADLVCEETADESTHARVERLVEHIERIGCRVGSAGRELLVRRAAEVALVFRRFASGRSAVNYHASETVARHPLAYYLAATFAVVEGYANAYKAPVAVLALIVADALSADRTPNAAALYTNESVTVARHVAEQLGRLLDIKEQIPVLPCWEARQPLGEKAWCFTTDPSFAADHPDALLVPALPTTIDLVRLDGMLATRADAARADARNRLVKRYGDLAAKVVEDWAAHATAAPDGAAAPDDVEAGERFPALLLSYRTLCVVWCVRDEPSSITVGRLQPEAWVNSKAYRCAINARFNPKDMDAETFFAVLSDELSASVDDSR